MEIMDDLISRTLALEAISAVKSITWSQSGQVLCGKMYSQIKNLPTIDAIPVEWLREYDDAFDNVLPISSALRAWEEGRLNNG